MKNFLIIFLAILPIRQYAQDTIRHDQLEEKTREAVSSGEYMYLYEGEPFTGVAETYGEDDYHLRTTYKNGKKHGVEVSFYEGHKSSEKEYEEGIPVGDIKTWYSNGNLFSIGRGAEIFRDRVEVVENELSREHFSDTLPLPELVADDYFYEGEWKYYYLNGELMEIGTYKAEGYIEVSATDYAEEPGVWHIIVSVPTGSREGWWRYYDEEGRLYREAYYEKDELLEEIYHEVQK